MLDGKSLLSDGTIGSSVRAASRATLRLARLCFRYSQTLADTIACGYQRCTAGRQLKYPDAYLEQVASVASEDGGVLLHNIVVRPVSSGQSIRCLLQITDVTVSVTRERVLRDRQNARYHAIIDPPETPSSP